MKKIGIVGTEITEGELWERAKGFELWSVNNLYGKWPETEFARWFELHTIERALTKYSRRGFLYYPIHSEQTVREYMEQLDALEIPVMMQKKWKIVRQSQVFPFDAIKSVFGNYFGCSFAWMVAYATMFCEPEIIGFFGVNFGTTEYFYQRPSLERMIGFCEGKGIPVYIDETCKLLQEDYVYAIGENFDLTYLLHGRFMQHMAMMFATGLSEQLSEALARPEGRGRK